MADRYELTILFPCLNESKTLPECIQKSQKFLKDHHIQGEIIVVDNGSDDGSATIAERCGAKVLMLEEKGYGRALRQGIEAAQGTFIIMGDSDGTYDFGHLLPLLNKLKENYDVVIGNRFRGVISPGAMPFLNRYLGNPVLSGLGRLFFKGPIGDFHCGLRGGRKSSLLSLNLRTFGMEFASEMIIKALLLGMKLAEVPVNLYPEAPGRQSHLRKWRDGWRHLRFLLLFSPNWLFIYPGIGFTILGLFLSIRLIMGPLRLMNMNFDIQSLAYAGMLFLLGWETFIFGVSSRIFAISQGFMTHSPILTRISRYITLEWGLAAGGLCLIFGLMGTGGAIFFWKSMGFGDLNPAESFRLVFPSILLLLFGFQIIFSSFFLSLLKIDSCKPNPD